MEAVKAVTCHREPPRALNRLHQVYSYVTLGMELQLN